MSRFMAHPQHARRLHVDDRQPIDRWSEQAQLVAFVIGLGLILLAVTVVLPGAPS